MLRELVRQSGVAALSVDYKLSPEHRFPKAFDETVAMIRLVAREGAGLGVDPTRIAVGGDSAGGNLALAAALALRDAGERALRFMLLIYGVYSADSESAVMAAVRQGRRACRKRRCAGSGRPTSKNPSSRRIGAPPRSSATSRGCRRPIMIVGSLDPLARRQPQPRSRP